MSLHKFFKNYSLLARLALSTLFVICVPLLIFVWVSLDQASKRLTAQENARHLQIAGQFSNYVQSQRTNMIAVAARIGYEGKITLPLLESDKYNEIEAIRELKRYRDLAPLSSNCYIYFRGSDFLIGSDGKYDRDLVLSSDTIFLVPNERIAGLMQSAFDEQNSPFIFSSFPDTDYGWAYMYICIPISVSRNNDAVVLFAINRGSLGDSFLGQLNSGEYELYIFGEDNSLLAANALSLSPYIGSADLDEFLKSSLSYCDFSIDGDEHTIYKVYNDQLRMTFVTVPTSDAVSGELSAFYQLVRVMTLLLALLVFFLLAAFLYINYKPVLDTTRRIRSRYGVEYSSGGELETIEHAFEKKLSENAAILDQLAEQQLQLIDYTVKSILSGKSPTDEELTRCGLSPSHMNYCVMTAISPESRPILDTAVSLNAALAGLCDASLCMTDSFEDCAVLLISFNAPGQEFPADSAEKIYELLCTSCEEPLILGIGSTESDRSRIYISYINSRIAAEGATRPGIYRFEEVVASENKPDSYPAESVLRFCQYVRQGSLAPAMSEYDALFSYVFAIRSTILEHYIRYDVINTFLRLLSELEVPVDDWERSRLFAMESYAGLRECVAELTQRACGVITERRRTFNQTRMGRIVDYIDQNAADPDLGLPMIAAHFGVSMSSLSSSFNETIGRGLREYIVERRIEHAKLLMADSRLSVKEVAAQVGFRDVSYFIKLFKAATGCTPAKYREGCR